MCIRDRRRVHGGDGGGLAGFCVGAEMGLAAGFITGPGAVVAGLTGGIIGGLGGGLISRAIVGSFSLKAGANFILNGKYNPRFHERGASPPLSWENIPSSAKSFSLLMKQGKTEGKIEVKWLILNIDPKVRSIEASEEEGDINFKYAGIDPTGEREIEFMLVALTQRHINSPEDMKEHACGVATLKVNW
eukprot:TRINITY_DN4789_c0_g2_i1.p1 TRINITY_DN4789_c0_g2~~TRINITY_DN4789_c0_g2_i1.p1  ORF type:complete len:210 (+),score=50.49 TRINITY_DN4789_c0_g2_i1:64-630(+)